MSNLIAVYEARNVIYVKRGGLGFIVSKKTDATGSIALTDDEKEQLLKQNFEKYGVRKGQVPYGISDADIDFVRTNLSIAELQPFEETLADAINIAGHTASQPFLFREKTSPHLAIRLLLKRAYIVQLLFLWPNNSARILQLSLS